MLFSSIHLYLDLTVLCKFLWSSCRFPIGWGVDWDWRHSPFKKAQDIVPQCFSKGRPLHFLFIPAANQSSLLFLFLQNLNFPGYYAYVWAYSFIICKILSLDLIYKHSKLDLVFKKVFHKHLRSSLWKLSFFTRHRK